MWGKPFLVVFCSLLAASLSAAQAAPVHNPANGHYYDAISGALTWDVANAAAQNSSYKSLPGHLATVTSAAENQFIVSNFPQAVTGGYWLGGSQPDGVLDPAAGWQWVTGEPWSFTNWSPGEPNDFSGPGSESRLQFYRYDNTGHWNDGASTGPYGDGYVIEYEGPGNSQGNNNGLALLQPISPTLEGSLRSVDGTTPTTILFENRTSQTVQIFWLDYQGNRVYYNTLLPGQSYVQPTYLTHPWLVTDLSGNGLVIFLPVAQPGEAQITGAGGATSIGPGNSSSTPGQTGLNPGGGASPPGQGKTVSLVLEGDLVLSAMDPSPPGDFRFWLTLGVFNRSDMVLTNFRITDTQLAYAQLVVQGISYTLLPQGGPALVQLYSKDTAFDPCASDTGPASTRLTFNVTWDVLDPKDLATVIGHGSDTIPLDIPDPCFIPKVKQP